MGALRDGSSESFFPLSVYPFEEGSFSVTVCRVPCVASYYRGGRTLLFLARCVQEGMREVVEGIHCW
jgi:hypothetical protein